MEFDGKSKDPSRDKEGTLTLFELGGRLGFSGGGAFSGEAELSNMGEGRIDPLDPRWDWLEHKSALEFIDNEGFYNELIPGAELYRCPHTSWPRWTGSFMTPDGIDMNLTLFGINPQIMIGRIYYKGDFRGTRVLIDSRFGIVRDDVDTAGWGRLTEPHSFGSHCYRCTNFEGKIFSPEVVTETDSGHIYGVVENCSG
ncbi:hypothetical protein [Roseovarius albus]|nr:hypothetical protein [Roseovarius albus]